MMQPQYSLGLTVLNRSTATQFEIEADEISDFSRYIYNWARTPSLSFSC